MPFILHPQKDPAHVFKRACQAGDWSLAVAILERDAQTDDGRQRHSRAFSSRWLDASHSLSTINKLYGEVDVFRRMLAAAPLAPEICSQGFLLAMRQGLPAHALALHEHGANPFAVDSEGADALRLAAGSSSPQCCALAINLGIDPTRRLPMDSSTGITDLSIATERGRISVVELLYPHFEAVDRSREERQLLLSQALSTDNAFATGLAWPADKNIEDIWFPELFLSFLAGWNEPAERLINEAPWLISSVASHQFAIQDCVGFTALMWSVYDIGSVSTASILRFVELLLPNSDRDAVDMFGRDALMVALDFARPDREFIAPLLPWADLSREDVFGETALDKALARGHVAMAQQMISLGADHGNGSHPSRDPLPSNAQDMLDWMPLPLSNTVLENAKAIIRWVRLGANPLRANPYDTIWPSQVYGVNLVGQAVRHGSEEVFEEILRLDAEGVLPRRLPSAGLAIVAAARHGRLGIIRQLLKGGADPQTVDDQGRSALMCAMALNPALAAEPIIDCLWPLSNISHRDKDGSSCVDLALSSGLPLHPRIKEAIYSPKFRASLSDEGWLSFAQSSACSPEMARILKSLSSVELSAFIAGASHVDAAGRNALTLAATRGLVEPIKRLSALGCPEPIDILGRNLLMVSLDYAESDNPAALYLAQCSDLSLLDAFGQSARDHAAARGHILVAGMIDSLLERSSLSAHLSMKAPASVGGGRLSRTL